MSSPRKYRGGRPPSLKDGVIRLHSFGVRLSDEEHATLVNNAKAAGLSVSGFVVSNLQKTGALEKPKARRGRASG
jgi:hypothetical protein